MVGGFAVVCASLGLGTFGLPLLFDFSLFSHGFVSLIYYRIIAVEGSPVGR